MVPAMELKKPVFLLALVLAVLIVLVETGSPWLIQAPGPGGTGSLRAPTPGYGIPYLALLDGLLLFTVLLMGSSLVVPERIQGRVQGVATLVVSVLVILGAILLFLATLLVLVLMLSLLLAVPFGTIVYFILYADFDRSGARAALSLLMLLKLGFAGCLVLAHPRFLQNKGLVLLVLTSLLAMIVVSFLHGLVPRFLVSITDAVAGLVHIILAAIWAVVFLVGSIVSIVKALRVDRGVA
jgi:ABC-type multidrug transport system fused ATPase/permease subunit